MLTHPRRSPWELSKLELIVQIAELGNLTKVATARGTNQPAISRQVSQLEQVCGGKLFHRTGRGVIPTELGEHVLKRAREILQSVDHLSKEVGATADKPRGIVRLAMLPWMSRSLAVPLYRLAREQLPEVTLQILEGSTMQIDDWLGMGFIAIGLPFRLRHVVGNPQEDRLFPADFYLVGPAGDVLTLQPTIEFEMLADIPLVLPGSPNNLRIAMEELARSRHLTLNVILRADSIQVQKEIVRHRQGYAVLPAFAVSEEVECGEMQIARILHPALERDVVLSVTHSQPCTLATRAVVRLIHEIASTRRSQTPGVSAAEPVSATAVS